MRLAARPAGGRYTYGLKRTEILSAQANGITLIVLALWLAYEAIRRLITPPAVVGSALIWVALAGIAVNVATTMFVGRASRAPKRSLNLEGAFRHLLTDVYAFIATAIAGVIIVTTGFVRANAIASLIVVVLMLLAGFGLVRDANRIFLEAAPTGLAPGRDRRGHGPPALCHRGSRPACLGDQLDLPAASAHVLVDPGQDCHAVRAELEELLSRDYGAASPTPRCRWTTRRPRCSPSAPARPPRAAQGCSAVNGPNGRLRRTVQVTSTTATAGQSQPGRRTRTTGRPRQPLTATFSQARTAIASSGRVSASSCSAATTCPWARSCTTRRPQPQENGQGVSRPKYGLTGAKGGGRPLK